VNPILAGGSASTEKSKRETSQLPLRRKGCNLREKTPSHPKAFRKSLKTCFDDRPAQQRRGGRGPDIDRGDQVGGGPVITKSAGGKCEMASLCLGGRREKEGQRAGGKTEKNERKSRG